VRVRSDPVTRGLARIATLGYALPGTVLAVGVFVPMAGLNNLLESAARAVGGDWPGYLQGSVAVLLLAYAVRFLAVGHAPIEANLGRITPRIDDGARLLGATGFALLRRVHLPLLRTGLLTAAVLVLVAVIGAAIVAEWERLPGFIAAVGAACLAFNLLSMAVGYGLPRLLNLPRSQAIAISMEIGIHNGTLAIFIALTVLQNATMSVPAAVYSIIMFVTAGAFTFWLNRGR
jgi:ABC-type spermidine/putrescine transport system permease subunit II